MKAVMISINPKWCELIAKGQKTIEVRKTRPKLKPPFKCYIYCTEGEALAYPHLNNPCFHFMRMNNGSSYGRKMTVAERNASNYTFANGKVIGEFVCDRISEYHYVEGNEVGEMIYDISTADGEATCLDLSELHKYGNGKTLYGWHISDLVIYDKPKELSEFYNYDTTYNNAFGWAFSEEEKRTYLKRPPQSWRYVEEISNATF